MGCAPVVRLPHRIGTVVRPDSILGGLLLLASVLMPRPSAGQGVEVPFTVWGLEDGLSHSSIRTMIQDSAGILWFGTQGGLNRFDGRTFRPVMAQPEGTPGLTDDYIHALATAPGGRLWVGTELGLELFDPRTEAARALPMDSRGSWPPLDDSDTTTARRAGRLVSMQGEAVLALAQGEESVLSLVTLDEEGYRASRLLEDSGRPTALCGTPAGALVALGAGRVVRLDGLGRRLEDLPAAPDTLRTLVCEDDVLGALADGRILTLGGEGWRELGSLTGSAGASEGRRSSAPAVRDIAAVGDSLLWLGTGQGLYQLDLRTGTTTSFPVGGPGQIPHQEVYDLLVDRTGVTWVGTWTGLAAAPPLVRAMDRALVGRELPASGGVLSILPLPDGGTLLGLDRGGVARLGPWSTAGTPARRPPGLSSLDTLSVFSLAREEDGTVWIATFEDGVRRWTPGEPAADVPFEMPANTVQGIAVDRDGDVWAAARNLGLARLDREAGLFRVVVPSPADGSWYFWSIRPDPEGGLWVGAPFEGLYRVSPAGDTIRRIDAEIPSDRILTVTRTRDGALWLGTEGDGLIRYQPAGDSLRVWTTADGLPHDNVQRILEDRTGTLWVSTNNGVALLDPDAGPTLSLRRRHGLAGNRFFANAGALAPDGRVVLGGPDGVTGIRPDAVRAGLEAALPSQVNLTRFSLLGRDTSLAVALAPGGLSLDHDQNFFTFEFAATDYTDPSLNRYLYRLDPLDGEWRDAGNNPVGTYTSVPPGHYTFQVLAGNSYGIWTPEPALAIPVVVNPAFWQTIWFQTLGVLAAAALLAAFFRYRYEQVAARARLRLDIAGKLHDDIGADLSTIALKTELVRATATLDERRTRQLEAASRLARETAHRVRETVWLVNTQYDTLPGLVAKLRDTADVMLSGQVRYDFVEPASIPDQEVGMEIRQHIHLLFKETLNNLVKHAGARHVHIEVAATSRELRFEVEDDGVGFDPGSADTGSGQRLMRERARAAHGSIDVRSAPGEGTRVAFRGRLR